MTKYVSLLRGINVGGNRKIKMADLRNHLSNNGLSAVQTYIQSGNVIFEHKDEDTNLLSNLIINTIQEHYGFEISVMTFNAADFKTIVQSQPFNINETDIKQYHVMMTNDEMPANAATQLEKYIKTEEEIIPIGQCLYLRYPNGFGRSKLTINVVEKRLTTNATARNWRTMTKLFEMLN